MHMGISEGNQYDQKDLLTHLKIIQSYIEKIQAKHVLELGPGNGSNSMYLAKHNPTIEFVGIDLSKKPLKNHYKNYNQKFGDFHDLYEYKDENLDLVFVIEALCHSNKKERVLDEVYKKLRRGGLFIIFDGYSYKTLKDLSENEILAKKLTEKKMAVDSIDFIDDFENIIKKSNFNIVERKDYSAQILPSLKRFERRALMFYKYRFLKNILKAVLPYNLTKNSIAGLLMPTLIQRKMACYFLHVLQKD